MKLNIEVCVIRQMDNYSLEILKNRKKERFNIPKTLGLALIKKLNLKEDKITPDLAYWE